MHPYASCLHIFVESVDVGAWYLVAVLVFDFVEFDYSVVGCVVECAVVVESPYRAFVVSVGEHYDVASLFEWENDVEVF